MTFDAKCRKLLFNNFHELTSLGEFIKCHEAKYLPPIYKTVSGNSEINTPIKRQALQQSCFEHQRERCLFHQQSCFNKS